MSTVKCASKASRAEHANELVVQANRCASSPVLTSLFLIVPDHSGREKRNGKERRKKSGDRSQLVKNPAGQFGGNELRAGWKEERLRKRMRLGVKKKGLSRRLGWESSGALITKRNLIRHYKSTTTATWA